MSVVQTHQNQFQNFYSDKNWPHVYWTTVPLFSGAKDLDSFTMSYRAERLKPTFANILKEAGAVEVKHNDRKYVSYE